MHKRISNRLPNNRKHLGEVVHKSRIYPGEHDAIISQSVWDDVHKIFVTDGIWLDALQ